VLAVSGLVAGYGDVRVLHGVTFRVEAGEIASLVGANGAGKTTTMRAVSGTVAPREGDILLDGEPLHRLRPAEIVRRGVVQVPEGRRIFPQMTVRENLLVGGSHPGARPRRAQTLEEVLALFPVLADRRDQMGGTLSGGEQQMLAIGRGLMSRPRLLMLDEPSLGLAPLMVAALFDIIRRINRAGVTILLVEQNVQQALALASRAYVLENGQIALSGSGPDLLANPDVRRAYLGL
jgi:branched-chain amino acid transport system ATP-binding protein